MKVFEIKTQGETDWLAFDGEIREAIAFYIDEYDNDENIDSISVLPREKWKTVEVHLEDEPGIAVTLEKYMKDQEFNEIIASTVY